MIAGRLNGRDAGSQSKPVQAALQKRRMVMRKLTILLAAVLVLGTSGMAMALGENSSTATAQTSATVVTPILITKTSDLLFGKIVPGATEGTVVLAPSTDARTVDGGTTLGNSPGTAAAFTVTGQGSATYSITLPGSAITLSDSTTHSMTADTFTSDPTPTGTLSIGGSGTLKVGGTLHVNTSGNNPAGTYTNASGLSVTVAYN